MSDDAVEPAEPDEPAPKRRMYFINEQVEWELTVYLWGGCTNVKQRDRIMSHATELIRQIIRKQGLHTIYPGQEESAFGDLLQTAWMQIERTLYKYRARPHCRQCFNADRPNDSVLYTPGDLEYGIKSIQELIELGIITCPKCGTQLTEQPLCEASQGFYGGSTTVLYRGIGKVFNMWSQVARTVILAYIKKEGRDRKNSGSYTSYLDNRGRTIGDTMTRFLIEARELCKYNAQYLSVLDAMEYILHHDDRPHDGIIGKLVERSGAPRSTVTSLMKLIRLRSNEFTDSPINREIDPTRTERRRITHVEFDDESS
jgi:hypothetical protein